MGTVDIFSHAWLASTHPCCGRLLQATIACIEQDRPTSVERPLDPDCSGISSPYLRIESIPHPGQWDDAWLIRIKALTPKDLTILHRQFMQRCTLVLHKVRQNAPIHPGMRRHVGLSCRRGV